MKTNNRGTLRTLNIPPEELPVGAGLRVIRKNDPDFGFSDDDISRRYEFIDWYLRQEHEALFLIPKPANASSDDFFIPDVTPADAGYGAFQSMDYQRNRPSFDACGYALKKIFERAEDLAILHSVISSSERRADIRRRFEGVIELEFRSRIPGLVAGYRASCTPGRKQFLKRKIGSVNRSIIRCRMIWEQNSPPDGG